MPLAFFEFQKITQVMENLISNAIKFTDEGGVTVTSTFNTDENYVKVTVKDTGIGIKEEDKPKLFQKFQQLADPAHNSVGGTGLGLSICKEILIQHHGRVGVETKLGEGSCFYIVFPIEKRRV